MSTKKVLSRIQNKHDTAANWALATHFVPLPGEIIIYDRDENYSYPRIKIGDGVRCPEELPFANLPTDNTDNSNQGIYQIYSNMVHSLEDDVTDANYPSANAVKAYVASNTMRCYATTATLLGGEDNWDNGNEVVFMQEVIVAGVTADNVVQIAPDPASYDLWTDHGIRCVGQYYYPETDNPGRLRFFAYDSMPEEDITVNILIFDTFEYGDDKEY